MTIKNGTQVRFRFQKKENYSGIILCDPGDVGTVLNRSRIFDGSYVVDNPSKHSRVFHVEPLEIEIL